MGSFPLLVCSDDDDGVGNPLVTGFQDDVDPEDVRPSREAENFADPPRESSEDEEESPAAVYTKDVQGALSFVVTHQSSVRMRCLTLTFW